MASNPTGPRSGNPTGPRSGTKGVPRAERERQILDAATEEFGRRGYAGASLSAVAARVGVTKTLLHQYFGTKQDLWLACLTPAGDRLLAAVREAMAEGGADPRTPLRVLRAVFTALEGRREAWFVLYDPSLPADGEAARRAAYYRDAIDELAATGSAELLRATASATASPGVVGGPVDAETLRLDADALKYAWRGLVTALVRWWISHPGESPDAMARRCARLFAAAGAAFAADDET
ncbi:TetR/AcrR family transcriptional regulator [Streptomyces sp. NPDC005805]|uniref:TetR/AcrR family transcriptional regulator n=1 Tax=Streptomyces sp. NPDC005805 TaxID=3157068 RepID=UPI0033EA45A9